MAERGNRLYRTSGLTGLSRDQAAAKVRDLLDGALKHNEGLSRVGSYTGALAAKVTSYVTGLPIEESAQLEHHLASAAGFLAHKVLASPAWRRLAARAITSIKKSLTPNEAEDLKGIVANVITDTRLDPRISCDDAALAEVARGAYQHCWDRLCALKQAASN